MIVLGAAVARGGVHPATDTQLESSDGGRGQDHVDFSVGGTDHVDLAIGQSRDDVGEDRGNGHINFSLAPDGGFSLDAAFQLADQRIDLVGARGDERECFRITIQPEGRVDVNGQEFAACDPADGCRLSLAWSSGASTLVVQVEQADGSLAAGQFYLAEAPTEISVEAAEIRLLSITPQ